MANNNPPDPTVDRTHFWEDEEPQGDPIVVVETGTFTCGWCGCALADAAAKQQCTKSPAPEGLP
jgi:hypothetical protein